MDIRQDIPKIIEAVLEIDNRVDGVKILDEREYDDGTRGVYVLITELKELNTISTIGLNLSNKIEDKLNRESPYLVFVVNTLKMFSTDRGLVIYERP